MPSRRRFLALPLLIAPPLVRGADTADAILRRMAAAYAALGAYQDSGDVRYEVTGTAQQIVFRTAFERPRRFRFEWIMHHPFAPLRFFKTTRVLRSDGESTFTAVSRTWGKSGEQRDESLARGVAGATGVSAGSVHTIATLLIPNLWASEPFGVSLVAIGSPRLMGVESVESVECHRVEGVSRQDEKTQLWIGRDDNMLRRVARLDRYGNVETRRGIVVNAKLAPELFVR